jgi:excisionase family DNA binding protein
MKTKINELCRAANVTTAYQLQKLCNLSPSQAARIFNDKVEAISLSVLETLCNSLKCSPNDIFGYDVAPVKADKPKQKGVLWAGKPPGESWKNSVLDIVQSSSDNELLSTVQVAARLNVSRKSVNDYIISGKLRAVKGKQNHNFIRESDLLAFMAKK